MGLTTIDLEDRIYSSSWQSKHAARPPVEWRALYNPPSTTPQGTLECFVEIYTAQQADAYPPQKITPPEPQEWELRVIVWNVDNMPKDVDLGGMADAQVVCSLGDARLETDTHFRAKKGKASFNWRMKFPVTLKANMKYQRLQVQLWDKDLLTSNDMIGEATLKLDRWFRRLYRKRRKVPNYWDAEGDKKIELFDPNSAGLIASLTDAVESLAASAPLLGQVDNPELDAAKWYIPLSDFNRDPNGDKNDRDYFAHPPRVVMSLEMVPIKFLEKLPAGDGRSEPNKNPTLPKPVGRLRFTLNPFAMIYQLVGPDIYKALCGLIGKLLCCALCILLAYYTIPVVFGNIVSAPFVG